MEENEHFFFLDFILHSFSKNTLAESKNFFRILRLFSLFYLVT